MQGPAGDWWFAYHRYENGYRTLGRRMLLDPIVWTDDGWPRATGGDLGAPLKMPGRASSAPHGIALSGGFSARDFGTRCAFYEPKPDYLARAQFDRGSLILPGQGKDPGESSPLAFIVGERSYTFDVEIAVQGDVQAGLLLFYDGKLFCGIGAERDTLHAHKLGKEQGYPPPGPAVGERMTMRVINDENVASFFIRAPGAPWRKVVSYEVSGYNHNTADGFMSLRPAVFAAGPGRATFRSVAFNAAVKADPF